MRPHPSTPAERIVWIGQLLAHDGEYGVVTSLARTIGVSRQTLTRWREEGRRALLDRRTPPPRTARSLRRAVLTLYVEGHASYRGIQACLAELLDVRLSLGAITRIVREAGTDAAVLLRQQTAPAPVALALDECFGGAARQGYLNAVDARTGVVWATAGPVVPSEAAWRAVLSPLATQGVVWSAAVLDGGKPAAAAIAALTPDVPRQRDIWHVLHRCGQAQARLARVVRAAEDKWERAERYAAAIATGARPKQRPPVLSAAAQAGVVDDLAQIAATLAMLIQTLTHLLEVVVVVGDTVRSAAARRADWAALLALLDEVARTAPAAMQPHLVALHRALVEVGDGALVFADALEAVHQAMRARLGSAGLALAAWAWQRRAVLGDGEPLVAQFPPASRPAIRVLITAWSSAVRASSAVEGWHSCLRPHLAVHRTLSAAHLALLAVRHNHRAAPRGVHAGQSPLHRSGVPDAPTDWLALLDAAPVGARPSRAPAPNRLCLAA